MISSLCTNITHDMHRKALVRWYPLSAIRTATIEPGMSTSQILVLAPPVIRVPIGPIAPKFEGGERKCLGLATAYSNVCGELNCHFFDAGNVVTSRNIDGVHLDLEQHLTLGNAVAKVVKPLLLTNAL